jgi:hypothetical protein
MKVEKMEGSCSTGQSPQWAVVPMEEEEEEEEDQILYLNEEKIKSLYLFIRHKLPVTYLLASRVGVSIFERTNSVV